MPPGVEAAAGAAATSAARGAVATSRTDRILMPIPPAIAARGLPATVVITDDVLQLPEARFLRVVRRNANLREMGELVVRRAWRRPHSIPLSMDPLRT